jgi:hypothetical protein
MGSHSGLNQWQRRTLARLASSKRAGLPFEHAWADAIRHETIPASDGGGHAPTLFAVDGMQEETVFAFFERVCRDAYLDRVETVGSGNGPKLREFCPGMLGDREDVASYGWQAA